MALVPLDSASKTQPEKNHFVHQKVKQFRVSEQILSVLMWGVSHIISKLSDISAPVMMIPDDSKAYRKIKVDNHLFRKGEPSQSL